MKGKDIQAGVEYEAGTFNSKDRFRVRVIGTGVKRNVRGAYSPREAADGILVELIAMVSPGGYGGFYLGSHVGASPDGAERRVVQPSMIRRPWADAAPEYQAQEDAARQARQARRDAMPTAMRLLASTATTLLDDLVGRGLAYIEPGDAGVDRVPGGRRGPGAGLAVTLLLHAAFWPVAVALTYGWMVACERIAARWRRR